MSNGHVLLWLLCGMCCCCVCQISAAAPSRSGARRLMFCLNKHQPRGQPYSRWRSVLSDEMTAAVPVAGVWWSAHAPAAAVTIVTQLSLDRLGQLHAQCRSWPGPISAALYVPLDHSNAPAHAHVHAGAAHGAHGSGGGGDGAGGTQHDSPADVLAAAIQTAQSFHARAQKLACQLDLLLAYERFKDSNGTAFLYPVNILRNYARLQARTPLIGLFDADMLPSLSLFEELQDPAAVRKMLSLARGSNEQAPGLLVLPAFIAYDAGNRTAERIADRLVTVTSKGVLAAMWRNNVIDRFDPTDKGHNATQYARWPAAKERYDVQYEPFYEGLGWLSAKEQYEVQYEPRYEPWVVCDRLLVPWYDARFRGYGQNKIVHLEHMNHTGFRFVVHPSAWLIHRRHELGKSKLQHLRDFTKLDTTPEPDRRLTIYGHSMSLGREIRTGLQQGTYHPIVDQPTRVCVEKLAWWHQDHWRWQKLLRGPSGSG